MHKDIVFEIKKFIEGNARLKGYKVFILSQKSNAFWEMIIEAPQGREQLLSHVRSIAMRIGRMHGEGLWEKMNRKFLWLG